MDNKTKDLIASFIFCVYAFVVFTFLPYLAIFGGGGIEESLNLDKVFLYANYGVVFIIFAFKITRFLLYDKVEIFKYVDIPFFDPENSVFGRAKDVFGGKQIFKIISSPILLVLATLIVVLPISVLAGTMQNSAVGQFFPNTGIPEFAPQQQITESASLSLAVEPASTNETTNLFMIHALLFILAGYLFLYKLRKSSYGVILFFLFVIVFIPVADGIFWGLIHSARYSNVEFGFLSTFMFGLIQGLMMSLTFAIFPAIIYHQMNNLIQKAFELFGVDLVVPLAGIMWVIFVVLFILYYFRKKESQESATLRGL